MQSAVALKETRESPPQSSSMPHQRRKVSPPAPERQHPLVIQLRKYAQVFGDFEVELLEAAQRIHRKATVNDPSMRDRIVQVIDNNGCNDFRDIVEESGFDEVSVRRICQELIDDGDYESRPVGHKTDVARGRRWRGIFRKTDIAGSAFSSTRSSSHYHNDEADDDDE